MPHLKTLLIDDDPDSRKIINELFIKFIPEAIVVGEAETVTDALELLKKEKPQLVILNTELKNESGFQFLEKAGKINFEIVFTTSKVEHALLAYNFPAADLLLKPITPELLRRGFTRALDRFYSMKTYEDNPMLLDFELKIPDGKVEKVFHLEQVIRLESKRGYCWIISNHQPPFLAAKHLASLEEILAQRQFIRVHTSHMVNTHWIKQFHASENQIEMKDGSRIPVSRERRKELKSILLQYIAG